MLPSRFFLRGSTLPPHLGRPRTWLRQPFGSLEWRYGRVWLTLDGAAWAAAAVNYVALEHLFGPD